MKEKILCLILVLAIPLFVSCDSKNKIKSVKIINCDDCLVTQEETAIKIAEAILFERFSEKKIKEQKPYIVTVKNDSIWVLDGTFNKIGYGGTFHIEISSKNGEIIDVFHYK